MTIEMIFQLAFALIFALLSALIYVYGDRVLERRRRKMIEFLHLPSERLDTRLSRNVRRAGVRLGALALALMALMCVVGLFVK